MVKVIHFICDRKYSDSIMDIFRINERGINHCFALCNTTNEELTSIKRNSDKVIRLAPEKTLDFIINNRFNSVILHDFNSLHYNIIRNIPNSIKIFWIAWGTDIYSNIMHRPFIPLKGLYRPRTRKAKRETPIHQLRCLHGKIDGYLHHKKIEDAVRRVDYFSGVLPEEYLMMAENDFFKAIQFEFNYPTLNTSFDDRAVAINRVSGNNIICGNSGDPTNNHIDAYELISRRIHSKRLVYSFLSYGGSAKYKLKVMNAGAKYFGDENFIGVSEFLNYDDYENILLSSSNVVMFHERQQAVGNILSSMWLGCKVFMSETSVCFRFFKRLGAVVFSFQNDFYEDRLNSPLSETEVKINRGIVLQTFGNDALLNKIDALYDIILTDKNES